LQPAAAIPPARHAELVETLGAVSAAAGEQPGAEWWTAWHGSDDELPAAS
jgi:hypothetical protein